MMLMVYCCASKRNASQTPPDQQADPGAGQGAPGMFDFVRSKAKKLPGS